MNIELTPGPQGRSREQVELENRLWDLMDDAQKTGFVLTVELRAGKPYTMGSYKMVGHVRPILPTIRKAMAAK